jgi:glutaredoxin 3
LSAQPEIVIYSTAFCGYCAAAKSLLQEKGVAWREVDVSGNQAGREEMTRRSGRRTVPQIFIGDQHIGGFEDLAALDQQGELDTILGIGD